MSLIHKCSPVDNCLLDIYLPTVSLKKLSFHYACNVSLLFVEYEVMRLHRFYVKQPLGEELVVENRALIHQWTSVFRYTHGDAVVLFSPESPNIDYTYTITSVTKAVVTLSLVSSEKSREVSDTTLYMALVKKDTFETIARQATELGVKRIVPFISARSEKKNLDLERLERIVIEASEQSGRGAVPELSPILTIQDALSDGQQHGGAHFCASLYGKPLAVLKQDFIPVGRAAVWVGPEGGWTDEEEHLFKESGFILISLTSTVLKADTGAVASLTQVILR